MTDFGLLTILWLVALVVAVVRRWRAKTDREQQTYGVAWILASIPLCGYVASAFFLDPVPYLPMVPGSEFVVEDETGKPMNGAAVDVEWKVLPLTIDFRRARITPRPSDRDDVEVNPFSDFREGTRRAGFLELQADEKGHVVIPGTVKPFPPLFFVVGNGAVFGIRYHLHGGTAVRVYADGYLVRGFDVDRTTRQDAVRLRRPTNANQWEQTLAANARGGIRDQGDPRFVQYLSREIVHFVDVNPTSNEADALLSDAAGLNKKINRGEESLRLYRRVVERNRDRFLVRQAVHELEIPWFNEMARRDIENLRRDLELHYQTAGWRGSLKDIPKIVPPSQSPAASVVPPIPAEPNSVQSGVEPTSIRWQRPPATYGMVQHDEEHYVGLIRLLNRFNRQWDAIAWEDDEAVFERNPVILVSAGSSFNVPNRERIRGILERYVKRGGVLAIFDQRYGDDFTIAPRPPGESLAGLGWRENDLNPPNETVVAAAHPITAGLSSRTPDVQIDGYFTAYPSTATILFRQSTTTNPAMILYRYGKGLVVLYTSSPEWRAIENRITKDELTVVENLLNWIEAQVPK